MGLSLLRTSSKKKASALVMGTMAAISTVSGIAVPDYMKLTSTLKEAALQTTPVVPLEFTIGVKEHEPIAAKEMIQKHMGEYGSVAFVVRRPG